MAGEAGTARRYGKPARGKAPGAGGGAYASRLAAKRPAGGRPAAAEKRAEIGRDRGIRTMAIRAISGRKLAEKTGEKARNGLTGRGMPR